MILFVPTIFIGASYYNGEDPIATVKDFLGMDNSPRTEQPASNTSTSTSSNDRATFENVQDLRDEITQLKVDLAVTQEKLARCKADNVE
jgi:hypothetical protein